MDGYGRIGRLLRRLRRRAAFIVPLSFDDARDAVIRQNRVVFATQGAFPGPPWRPLSPRYAAWKIRMVGPRPILVFSGELRDSLTSVPMGVEIMGPNFYEFGTADPVAKFHQHGTRFMPARPPVHATEALENELRRIVADQVVGRDD